MLEPEEWERDTWRHEQGVQVSYLMVLALPALVLIVITVLVWVFSHQLVGPLLRALSDFGPG